MSGNNTFNFSPMVRFSYSFPDVDQQHRTKIYNIIHDMNVKRFRGGYGDGSDNSGSFYIPESEVENLRQRLLVEGLVEEPSDNP